MTAVNRQALESLRESSTDRGMSFPAEFSSSLELKTSSVDEPLDEQMMLAEPGKLSVPLANGSGCLRSTRKCQAGPQSSASVFGDVFTRPQNENS
jgi:hypothetical protein